MEATTLAAECAFLAAVLCLYTDASSRRASLSLGIVSMSRFPSAKTVSGTPCSMDLYRMYTNTEMTSWIDLCLTPFANLYDGDKYCSNCPVGPFLDYTNLVRSNAPPCQVSLFLSSLLTMLPRRNTIRTLLTPLASQGSRFPQFLIGKAGW